MWASAKTWTANAPATPRRTFPSSTALPSTYSSRTSLQHAESRANASKLRGIKHTYSNYWGFDMRRPCSFLALRGELSVRNRTAGTDAEQAGDVWGRLISI